MKVEAEATTQEDLLLPEVLAETTEDHKVAPDTAQQAVDLVHQVEDQAVAQAADKDTVLQLESQLDTDQLLPLRSLQPAALATKDHLDHLAQKAHSETTEKTETTERTEKMERTPNCWLPNRPKFASSAQLDHKDNPEASDQKAHPDQKAPQANHQRMAFPENKANKVNPEVKADQEEKDHVELQDNLAVSSQFPDHKAPLDHLEPLESQDLKANLDLTDNHSKDHLDYPEMPETQDAKVAQDQLDLVAPEEKLERKARASTALHHVPRQAIKPRTSIGVNSPIDFQVDYPFSSNFLYISVALSFALSSQYLASP